MFRQCAILCLFLAAAAGSAGAQSFGPAQAFDPAYVEARARALAAAPFAPADESLPAPLDALGYDAWRRIAFARERAVPLGNSAFRLQAYHRGWIFRREARIHLVRDGMARPLAFSTDLFDYGEGGAPALPADLGFAGFRLLHPLNRRDKLDEVISFLGASYFRFLGRGQAYGLSARGLALGAGDPQTREEFPAFREFWLEEGDSPGAPAIIHALMDSPSLAGAYRFVLHAGARSFVEIDAAIFPRAALRGLGLAPLTSMFMAAPYDRRAPDPFRPRVHDSDTLLLQMRAGGWIARALRNPERPLSSDFAGVGAFGLMQRARDFESYQDLEAHYHLRPSYWVTPRGDWGAGSVRLVELPAPDETGDNVVAFWAPAKAPQAGEALRLSYSVETMSEDERLHDLARTRAVHLVAPREAGDVTRRLILDFAGGDLAYHSQDVSGLRVHALAAGAQVLAAHAKPHPRIAGVRVLVDVRISEGARADVATTLRDPDGQALTETFLFPFFPESAEVTASTRAR